MTDDRELDEEQPRVRITDRRRFANLPDDGGAPATTAGAALGAEAERAGSETESTEEEAAEVAGDLQAAQGEAQQYLDHLRRLQAEFDNYRKRVMKEQTELAELGAMPVARRLLEVLDDFELALMSATDQPDFDRFLKGV
ncbi:MAG TPA: nucleotide exchange factor GrpE, partial [Actinomycetota bacterium]